MDDFFFVMLVLWFLPPILINVCISVITFKLVERKVNKIVKKGLAKLKEEL